MFGTSAPPARIGPSWLSVGVPTLLLMGSSFGWAATIRVDTFADEFGGAGGLGSGACSLREAVQSANGNSDFAGCTHTGAYGTNDTVQLPSGFYTLTQGDFDSNTHIDEDNNQFIDIDIRGDLTIDGLVTSNNLSIGNSSGDYRGRVFHVISGNVTINDVTLRDGDVPNGRFGGGLRSNPDTTVTLNGVRVFGNEADGGGGGILNAGTMTINDSKIDQNRTNNAVDGGGGIYNAGGTLTLNGSVVTGNRTEGNGANGDGAGIYNDSTGPLTLNNTSVHNNVVAIGGVAGDDLVFGNGGGLFSTGGSRVEITDSTFSNNIAAGNKAQGGGIRCVNGELLINRSLIAFNEARKNPDVSAEEKLRGGGISTTCQSLALTDSIISGNSIDNGNGDNDFASGGGIDAESDVRIIRSLVIGNRSSEAGGGLSVILLAPNDLHIVNSTISNNEAGRSGGGLRVSVGSSTANGSSRFRLHSSSILNNIANTQHHTSFSAGGASMEMFGSVGSGEIANTAIAGNVLEDLPSEGECEVFLTSLGNNLFQDGTGCDPQDLDPSDRIGQPAGLAAATNNGGALIGSTLGIRAGMLTRAPLPTSVLIDAGNPVGCRDGNGGATSILATDQIGRSRMIDGDSDGAGRCDIGAIEFSFALFADSFEE